MLYISFNLILHQFNAISRWFFLHWKILFQWVLIKCFLKIKMENKLIPVSFRLDQYMHFGLDCIRTWSARWHIVFDSIAEMVSSGEWSVSILNVHEMHLCLLHLFKYVHQCMWKRTAACCCVMLWFVKAIPSNGGF